MVDRLKELGIRVEVDFRNEKIGYKLREARNERVTYIGVIGEKEEASNTLSLRHNVRGDLGVMSVDDFIEQLVSEIENKESDIL